MRAFALATGGGRAGGIPETNTIRSVPKVMYRPAVRRHVTDFSEMSPAHAERYAFPAHSPPEFRVRTTPGTPSP